VKQSDSTQLAQVRINDEIYYQISNIDKMRPFFMSMVSHSNHWLFISSNGGLTAGRKDAEHALFPYYTDDKITESYDITGSKSIFWVTKQKNQFRWEPFSSRNEGNYQYTRNLYKSIYGNRILFEEINHDLDITFRYRWSSSNEYGFVREAFLINTGTESVSVSILDGLQNIIPAGVGSMLQNQRSNLVDAYKRNELDRKSGIGIYALSAIIVDRAEPSEALKANIAWSVGLDNPVCLLSSLQLHAFRTGIPVQQEEDIKAEKGAYFIHTTSSFAAGENKQWMIIANVNQSVSDILALSKFIQQDKAALAHKINLSINNGTRELQQLGAAADGLQLTADKLRDTRHFANTLFNIMRGGIFDDHYQIEKEDFIKYLGQMNRETSESMVELLKKLPDTIQYHELIARAWQSNDKNFIRLSTEYLPLKFSRRHGDPSRPWNQFSINTHNELDGSKILDYAGNWRDIFQNWEALAHAYPVFIEGMIFKFLNASTFDGYNPYRITKNGIDWETIEADDPWSYIGYWGDHQLIYLLKFLEFINSYWPGKLEQYIDEDVFVYANVPYKIREYTSILKNPKDTIDFDHESDKLIRKQWEIIGADSALLRNQENSIHYVNFIEKILATVVAKVSNFIPEGGIWMNTQRPEWNDANNALVGNGVSVVTLCYLRRFLKFLDTFLNETKFESVHISAELLVFVRDTHQALENHKHLLTNSITNRDRKNLMDGLGGAASNYRNKIYSQSFTNRKEKLLLDELKQFIHLTLEFIDHSLRANRRADNLFHSYNIISLQDNTEVSISHLSEMLEGQVAILSSGYLSPTEALLVLDNLRKSKLYREDQHSYLLYPNKQLPGFLSKNSIPASAVSKSPLLSALIKDNNKQVLEQDVEGGFHFNGSLKNSNDLETVLDTLAKNGYAQLVETDRDQVLEIYESVFYHKAFTGRSGTFFGYEGLGSIYWHMVSKLLLAAQECCQEAIEKKENEAIIKKLTNHFYEINEGIGVHKSPNVYGAFPTDPYSHTPLGKGAQQPGMTGQVKEDMLARLGEFGVTVRNGQLSFNPPMLRMQEFLMDTEIFNYVDIQGAWQQLTVDEGSLAFTYCQVPVIYRLSDTSRLIITMADESQITLDQLTIDRDLSSKIFYRTGEVKQIMVYINEMDVR
jgi:hypothetical protein